MEIRIGSKGKNLIEHFFIETLFKDAQIVRASSVDMRYIVTKRKKILLRNAQAIELMVLISLESNEINFVELVQKLLKDFYMTDRDGENKAQKKAFRVGWIVCSDSGGIYLWEALETAEHRRLQGAAHAFAVVNSVTAAVCFSPGALENRRVSERLISLSEELKGSFFGFADNQNRGKRQVESLLGSFFMILGHRLSRMRPELRKEFLNEK